MCWYPKHALSDFFFHYVTFSGCCELRQVRGSLFAKKKEMEIKEFQKIKAWLCCQFPEREPIAAAAEAIMHIFKAVRHMYGRSSRSLGLLFSHSVYCLNDGSLATQNHTLPAAQVEECVTRWKLIVTSSVFSSEKMKGFLMRPQGIENDIIWSTQKRWRKRDSEVYKTGP